MGIVNYGAKFTDKGLECDVCHAVNNFKVTGLCDATNGYGKVLKCCRCGNRITQMYIYENTTTSYRVSAKNIDIEKYLQEDK